jgi:Fe-S-cluster containining protein
VHLALHRDPASGARRVTLNAPLFEEPWQDDVAVGAANTALGVLGGEPSLDGVLALMRSVMDSTARLVAGLLARAPDGAVACKAGCDHCCHVVVGVTAPEALTIFDHLQRSRSPAELAALAARVATVAERTRCLSSSERFSPEYPCVFLEAGRCSIYQVRPLACRGMNSLDASECETRLRDPDARAAFAANGGGHLFVEPIRAFRAVSGGLQVALLELYHLDMTPLDLIAVMQILLQDDPSRARSWLAGNRAFESAALADQS